MAYDIRLIKLVTGELTIGKYNAEEGVLEDVAIMQSVPNQQGGMQLMLLPYGYPFEQKLDGKIEEKHFLYQYKRMPQELIDKYLETSTNITLSSGGFDPQAENSGNGSNIIL